MGRPPTKDRFRAERLALAGLIDVALKAGQRGDGTPWQFWQPWTEVGFAKAIGTGPSSISDWRDSEAPARPTFIVPILQAFYGNIPEYAEARKTMLEAWRRAGGIEDVPPEPSLIADKIFAKDVAEVAYLLLNQPTPDNYGNLLIPYTLWMGRDSDRRYICSVNGAEVSLTMDIGIAKALFQLDSSHWQPALGTIFRRKDHPNVARGPVPDSVWIAGPLEDGCVVGEPLKDEPEILLERRGNADSDSPITLTLRVPRKDGFRLTVKSSEPVSLTQEDVIEAIFAEGIPRDGHDRMEVASATIIPNAKAVS